jgi:hypothetical protein
MSNIVSFTSPLPSSAKASTKTIVVSIGGSDIPIFLIDGSAVMVRVKLDTTALGVCLAMKSHLGLTYDSTYGLFESTDGKDFSIDGQYKISKLLQKWNQESASSGPTKLLYRRFLHIPDSIADKDEDLDANSGGQSAHRMCYMECVYNFLHSRYRFDVASIAELALSLLQSKNGNYNRSRDSIDRIKQMVVDLCPAYVIKDLPLDHERSYGMGRVADGLTLTEWAVKIHSAYSTSGVRPILDAQVAFVKAVKTNPTYGCEFFPGKQTWEAEEIGKDGKKSRIRKYEEKIICVGYHGVFLLGTDNPLECAIYEYEDMKEERGWDVDKTGRIFALGLEDGRMIYILSDMAKDILRSLQSFVDNKVAFLIDNKDPTEKPNSSEGVPHIPQVVGQLWAPPPPYSSHLDISPSNFAPRATATAMLTLKMDNLSSSIHSIPVAHNHHNHHHHHRHSLRHQKPISPHHSSDEDSDSSSASSSSTLSSSSSSLTLTATTENQKLDSSQKKCVSFALDESFTRKGSDESNNTEQDASRQTKAENAISIPIKRRGLPPGWFVEIDREVNEPYYYFIDEAGETEVTWDKPEWPDENLDHDWIVLFDQEGDPYFFNPKTSETTWDKPRKNS